MEFRHCPRCKLLALTGEYCAGCGYRLSGPVVDGVSRSHLLVFLGVVIAGLFLGFGLSAMGFFREPTELALTATASVEDCQGVVVYAATVYRSGEPVPDVPVSFAFGPGRLETLSTDRNGRIDGSIPFDPSWCGTPTDLVATVHPSVTRSGATARTTILSRVPVTIGLQAPQAATAGTPTLVTVAVSERDQGVPVKGSIVRLALDGVERYAATGTDGRASFTIQGAVGVSTLSATLLGEERYGRVEGPSGSMTFTAPRLTDRVPLLRNHTVGVMTPASIGSGVVLMTAANTTLIVTNRHVIDGSAPDRIAVVAGGTIIAPTGVRYASDDIDLALLIMPETFNASPAMVARSLPARGEAVVAIGNPLGLDGSVSRGIVSNVLTVTTVGGVQYAIIQTDAALNPGNSGGGLFLESTGELVGIVVAKRSDAEGIGFAISSGSLME